MTAPIVIAGTNMVLSAAVVEHIAAQRQDADDVAKRRRQLYPRAKRPQGQLWQRVAESTHFPD